MTSRPTNINICCTLYYIHRQKCSHNIYRIIHCNKKYWISTCFYQLFIYSKLSCLLVSPWYESNAFFSFSSQTRGYPLKTSWHCRVLHRKALLNHSCFWPLKCHLVKNNIIPRASGLCYITLPPCINRLLESRSTILNASLVCAVKCSLEMETPTRSSNAPSCTGKFKADSGGIN